MALHLFTLVVFGLMCGSELNIAAFGHPVLSRQPIDVHIPVRSTFAVLFGRVMPFWMGGSALLTLLLLFPFEHLNERARHLAAVAFTLQVLMVLFSLVAPVPINNRIAQWTVTSLPEGWEVMERRWDVYHWLRTGLLVIAFALLALSFEAR